VLIWVETLHGEGFPLLSCYCFATGLLYFCGPFAASVAKLGRRGLWCGKTPRRPGSFFSEYNNSPRRPGSFFSEYNNSKIRANRHVFAMWSQRTQQQAAFFMPSENRSTYRGLAPARIAADSRTGRACAPSRPRMGYKAHPRPASRQSAPHATSGNSIMSVMRLNSAASMPVLTASGGSARRCRSAQ
jgi:hypothetical protein